MRTLVLAGSGEFTPAMEQTDRFLLSRLALPRVAVFPTAAGREHDAEKWIANGVSHFTRLGANVVGFSGLHQEGRRKSGNHSTRSTGEFFLFFRRRPRVLV